MPHAFLSYTRFDDTAHRGAIRRLREELEQQVRVVTGDRDFEIFQDIDDLKIGQEWQERINGALATSAFLIPVLTPSFFRSKPCRDEFKRFLDHELAGGRAERILPIYFVTTPLLEREETRAKDELAEAVAKRQRWDWRKFAMMSVGSVRVRAKVRELAEAIAERMEAHSAPIADIGPARLVPLAQPAPEPVAPAPLPPQAPVAPPSLEVVSVLPAPGTFFRDVPEPWCPELVVIPAGRFMMGSPEDEEGRVADEGAQHEVRIARPFALGRYTVTFDEYDAFCTATGHRKPNDLSWGRGRRPVIDVSWDDATAYCAWLVERTGQPYRLPSEAEWEYACRAGTTTPFWTGATVSTNQANYDGNYVYGNGKKGVYREKTVAVDDPGFPANGFGLSHMHGNVWEWCEDIWHEDYASAPIDGSAWTDGDPTRRVLRGGSWYFYPWDLRSALRGRGAPGDRDDDTGFRVARTFTP